VALLHSSPEAWLQEGANIQPDLTHYPDSGFGAEGELATYVLAASLQGRFVSYFAGKPNPLIKGSPGVTDAAAGAGVTPPGSATPAAPIVTPLLYAAEDARLVVVGSSEFVDDAVLQLTASLAGEQVLNNVQFVQNAVDWAVEDMDLLDLRSRGFATRLLVPLTATQQQFWELLTYFLVLGGLAAASAAAYAWRRERPMALTERDAHVKASTIG
jgi:ABC-2 type transport system permease protein